jgi:hypothetical protein
VTVEARGVRPPDTAQRNDKVERGERSRAKGASTSAALSRRRRRSSSPRGASSATRPTASSSRESRGATTPSGASARSLLKQACGEQADEQLISTIRRMCEVVERHEHGWLAGHGQCVEAANVEPQAVALLAAQEAAELVIAGYTIEEGS